jgi:hypothetical protein
MLQIKRTTIIAAVIAIILTLASAVTGLALWNETLILEGNVATGKVDAEVTFESAIDNEETHDVAQCSAKTGDMNEVAAPLGGGGPSNKLSIFVENGYPGYKCRVRFGVYNNGSIPVLVSRPDFTETPPADALIVLLEECYSEGKFLARNETVSCTLVISVEHGAEQSQSLQFEANVEARQFN